MPYPNYTNPYSQFEDKKKDQNKNQFDQQPKEKKPNLQDLKFNDIEEGENMQFQGLKPDNKFSGVTPDHAYSTPATLLNDDIATNEQLEDSVGAGDPWKIGAGMGEEETEEAYKSIRKGLKEDQWLLY